MSTLPPPQPPETSTSAAAAAPDDRSFALCEVLEREYEEITGDRPDPPPAWTFTPEQILEPRRLAQRLLHGHDHCARDLGRRQLHALVQKLQQPGAFDDSAKLRRTLADGLNDVLTDGSFYNRAQFSGVRLRSQTLDRLDRPLVERNRLLLEDTFIELKKLYDFRLAGIYARMHQKKLSALCLSGGGIRSATFALGVSQGLARHGLLGKFHYLSTVSGGGYLGAWLSAWIKHTNLRHVVQQLKKPPVRPLEPEPSPIWHLRNYSNYLSPRLGLLSADTWTLVATYLRNVFLSWLILVPVLVGLLTLPLVLLAVVRWTPDGEGLIAQRWLGVGLAMVGAFCSAYAVWYVHTDRPKSKGPTEGTGIESANRNQRVFLRRALLPLFLACVIGMVLWSWASPHLGQLPWWQLMAAFAAIGAVVHAAGWLWSLRGKLSAATGAGVAAEGLAVVLAGAAAGAALAWLVSGSTRGSRQIDATREWSARFSAWLLIGIVAWLVIFGLVILGPTAVTWLRNNFPRVLDAGKTVTGAIGVISGAFTLWKGISAGTPAKAKAGAPIGFPLALATTIFVVFLVVLFAWMGREAVNLALKFAGLPQGEFGPGRAVWLALLVAASLFLFGLASAHFIDTNKFSLHAMYRTRLIRAFLGASRPSGERDPHRFTGFDDEDNLHLRTLWPKPGTRDFACGRPPYHVVNAALNLVGGDRLAWQERKAQSFTFTPLYCGSYNLGFRPTWAPGPPDPPDPPAGYAVRKIRIDLGIPIEFAEPPFAIYARDAVGMPTPGKYCAVGRIRYGCVDQGAEDGVLLYVKPAFYGDEPKDVLNYARTSETFPHESTGDQFFSESQFESYRALGSHVIDQILAGASAPTECDPLGWLARSAREYAAEAPGATDGKPEYLSTLSHAGQPRTIDASLLSWSS